MKANEIVKAMLEEYYGEGSTEDLEDDDLNVRIYKAGIKVVVENQKFIDGKCTGDLECFCMVGYGMESDPYSPDFSRDAAEYPGGIADGEGRLIFVPKAKLKEWGIE